jgi:hypothetical protein
VAVGAEPRPGFAWSYRDQLFNLMVAFMALGVLALVTKEQKHATRVWLPPMIIEEEWDPGSNSDIDLWVQAPGELPVGYSNLKQPACNLLRDDLGKAEDRWTRNTEQVFCRGTPKGQWVVNVMAYDVYDGRYPVGVKLRVLRESAAGESVMLEKSVSLDHNGEELTVWRFVLDDRGRLVPGSVDAVPTPIRAPLGNPWHPR